MTLETNYHDFLKSKGLETDAGRPGGQIFSDDFRAKLPEELQIASYWAVEAIDIIHPNKMSPFVLYVSFLDPHPPFYGPLDRLDTLLIDPSFLKKPSGHSLFSRTRADFFMQSEFENTPDERSNATWEKQRRWYNKQPNDVNHDISTEAGLRRLRACYMAVRSACTPT